MSQKLFLLLSGSLVLLLSSCQNVAKFSYLASTQRQAEGLQSIRIDPPNVGYQRLTTHAELNSSIKIFLQKKGQPDYIIEDRRGPALRIVCFYVKKNQAYLIQAIGFQPKNTRVLGPEPIGEKDRRLFKALNEVKKATEAYKKES
jgi:hypothetical protein